MVWTGRGLRDPPVPTGAAQLKMATMLQGHCVGSISLGISLNTGAIWTGFLSRFRDNGCVSFGLSCGVDLHLSGKAGKLMKALDFWDREKNLSPLCDSMK